MPDTHLIDPRRDRRLRFGAALLLLVAATGTTVGALRAVQQRSRAVVSDGYAEQQRLLAKQTALRLGDLGDRIRVAASSLLSARSVAGGTPTLSALRAEWEHSYGPRESSLDLLAAHEFEVAVDRVRPHEHPVHTGGGPQAVPCHICVGEGATLPVILPLTPGAADGDVVEIAIPLSELSRRLVQSDRGDAVWWADRESGLLLASPSSEHLGEDLRSVAGVCAPGLEALLRPRAGSEGTARYCWPAAAGLEQRLAGFAGHEFLGLDMVVGVSIEHERAVAGLAAVQGIIQWLAALAVGGLVLAVAWMLLGARSRLLEERHGALASLSALSKALEARDRYTQFHSENVGGYAAELGRRMGLGRPAQDELRLGGRMHDLGKIGICDGVLNKPGALDVEERELMESHTEIGEAILGHLPWARSLAEVACCHHERMDGQGYPRQLRGGQIPRNARIVAVADVFDALLTDRPYRDALSMQAALDILQDMAGAHLDPDVVAALVADPAGLRVLGGGTRPAALVRGTGT